MVLFGGGFGWVFWCLGRLVVVRSFMRIWYGLVRWLLLRCKFGGWCFLVDFGLFSLVLILVGLLCGCSLCLVWLGWFVALWLTGWW